MFAAIPKVETAASLGGKRYAAANGSPIRNEGEKTVEFMTNCGKKQKVKFQLAEVTKVLLSADKINKAGFNVDLNAKNPMIMDTKTGAKIPLKRKNGIFVIDLWVNTEKVGRIFTWPGH